MRAGSVKAVFRLCGERLGYFRVHHGVSSYNQSTFLRRSPMRRNIVVFLALAGLVAMVLPAMAHHSFSAEFDNTKQVEKRGYVTKGEWANPHVWFYINVKDSETGKITRWGFEMGPPHGLQARGWSRDTMK